MNKERQAANENLVIIFNGDITDRDLEMIPENFEGDVVINGNLKTYQRLLVGNLWINGNMHYNKHLTVKGKIICFGDITSSSEEDLKTQKGGILCFGNISKVGDITSNGDIIAKTIHACDINTTGIVCAEHINACNIKTPEDVYSENDIDACEINVAGNVSCKGKIDSTAIDVFGYVEASYIDAHKHEIHVGEFRNNVEIVENLKIKIGR